jgi:putative addiction module CopG family antidote
MSLGIPSELGVTVQKLIADGKYRDESEVIAEGIRLVVAREALRQAVQVGVDQAETDDLHDHDTVFAQLQAMATEASDR